MILSNALDALIERERRYAESCWPQVYIGMRALGNSRFLLPANAWSDVAWAAIGCKAAYATLRTHVLLPPEEMLAEDLRALLERVARSYGHAAAATVHEHAATFLRVGGNVDRGACWVARGVLWTWLGAEGAVKAGVAVRLDTGVVEFAEDLIIRLGSLVASRLGETALADLLKAEQFQPRDYHQPDWFKEWIAIFKPARTETSRAIRLMRHGDEAVGARLSDGRLVARSRLSNRTRAASTLWTFRDRELQTRCDQYFQRHSDQRWIDMGLAALSLGNAQLFKADEVLPETSRPCPPAQFERRWSRLMKLAELGDTVLFRDTSSVGSNAIAEWDGNSWSHAAYYVHDGWLLDRRTDSESLTRLERYQEPQIRVGLYRSVFSSTPQGERAVLEYASENKRGSYDYLGAAWAGLKAKLPFRRRPFDPAATPNNLVYAGHLWLVCRV